MPKEPLWKLHEDYIKRTKPEAFVLQAKKCVTKTNRKTRKALHCKAKKTYITTRALKHLYDKKPAEEFDFMLDNIISIVRTPDYLYGDTQDRRNRFCLVKHIEEYRYLVAIEIIERNTEKEEIQIVTAFRVRDEKYLRNYDLLRSWRDGAHSS
jgi:hypothetical protein